jgi:TPR repeat protein
MEACDALGVLYQDGHGVARDHASARLFYKKACEGGDEKGCTHLRKLR